MSGSGTLFALLGAGLLFWPLLGISVAFGPWGVVAAVCLVELGLFYAPWMARLLRRPNQH